jgi:hypothetical protein
VSEAIETEPLLVVAPGTLRAAKFVRLTVPPLSKDCAVRESAALWRLPPTSSVPVLVSAPAIDTFEPPGSPNRLLKKSVGQALGFILVA